MKKISQCVIFVLFSFLVACGGDDKTEAKEEAPVKDVALFFVSGHDPLGNGFGDGLPSKSYLQNQDSAGPFVTSALMSEGYNIVFQAFYVDDAESVGGYGGYKQLVLDMQNLQESFNTNKIKVIVIAHSHGGVWAHTALFNMPNLAVTALVDLDTNSYGWDVISHTNQNDILGADPRDRFYIESLSTNLGYLTAPSEQTFYYDVEDVVFNNVSYALEVRSGEAIFGEWYDEKWNVREDGSTNGLFGYVSEAPLNQHTEVHSANGTTMPFVTDWLLSVLAE